MKPGTVSEVSVGKIRTQYASQAHHPAAVVAVTHTVLNHIFQVEDLSRSVSSDKDL